MPTENGSETRRISKPQNPGAPPQEQEHLPCPRCDSTNTKFCYYNNYNFSQPRHFCKSCRRYWTHGGTLRDIPVGGGIRKNAKRNRAIVTSSPSTVSSYPIQDHALAATATPFFVSLSGIPPATVQLGAADFSSGDSIAKQNLNLYGSFTSLLNNTSQCPGFGPLDMVPAVEDVSYEMGRGVWPFQSVVDGSVHVVGHGQVRSTGIGNTWQFENGEGRFVSGDCFS